MDSDEKYNFPLVPSAMIVQDNPKDDWYTKGSIQPVDYIKANELEFDEGNIIKYVTRYKFKNGIEDLKKARFYLNRLIEHDKN